MSTDTPTPCNDCSDAVNSSWASGLITGHLDCFRALFLEEQARLNLERDTNPHQDPLEDPAP